MTASASWNLLPKKEKDKGKDKDKDRDKSRDTKQVLACPGGAGGTAGGGRGWGWGWAPGCGADGLWASRLCLCVSLSLYLSVSVSGMRLCCGPVGAGVTQRVQLAPSRPPPDLCLRQRFVTQSCAPTAQVPPPVPSVELGALPASVEDWASYSCPEEVTAVFKQDKSDFMVNACSFHRPVSSPKDLARGHLRSRCHFTASCAVQKS